MAHVYFLGVKLDGVTVIDRRIARIQGELKNLNPLWGKVRTWFVEMEVMQFATEGRGLWGTLRPSTQAARARKGYGARHPILEMTGRLAASLAGGSGFYEHREPLAVTFGTTLHVGHWNLGLLHQRGTAHMMARPPIGYYTKATGAPALFQNDITKLRGLFAEYIHKIVTKGQ